VRVGPTLDKLLADYPNDLRVVFKLHPLPMHPNAMPAAQAAMAAKAQGKFQEMHEKLLVASSSGALSRDNYIKFATELGLDVKKFTSDIDGNAYKTSIDAMTNEAMKLGATGTPANFVNGRFVNGAAPYESFKTIIDAELAKAKDETKAKN
jgi:protein-disulfide isomerase